MFNINFEMPYIIVCTILSRNYSISSFLDSFSKTLKDNTILEMEAEKPRWIHRLAKVETWKNKMLEQNHTYLLHGEKILVLEFFSNFVF